MRQYSLLVTPLSRTCLNEEGQHVEKRRRLSAEQGSAARHYPVQKPADMQRGPRSNTAPRLLRLHACLPTASLQSPHYRWIPPTEKRKVPGTWPRFTR